MAFSELVKSFEKIRGYMREFYVYGFRTRSGFSGKSGRTYDNERRRLECVLGEHTESSRDSRGKNVFLSIDSRNETRCTACCGLAASPTGISRCTFC